MSQDRKHLRLGFSIWATGFHPAGWRVPGARADGAFDSDFLRDLAQRSERAKLDFFFIGEQVAGGPDKQHEHPNETLRPEALTYAAYTAAVTQKIGIVTTVNTTYSHPYVVARATATVDHLSKGRLALNYVTGRNLDAAGNFGREKHWQTDDRFDWATEFAEIVSGLWDTWEDDALIADRKVGDLLDPRKVHKIDYAGKHFSVRGPLNIARPPQGQIPVLHAGQSERSLEFGARFADIRFIHSFHLPQAKRYYADVKSRLAKYGRSEDSQQMVAGIAVYVGETKAEAHRLFRQIQELTITDYNLAGLSNALGIDLGAYTLDTWIEDIAEIATLPAEKALIIEQAHRSWGTSRLTLRELFLYFRRSGGGPEVVGDARDVADYFELYFKERATDGFILFPPNLPDQGYKFLDLVVPELQRRGLFRKEYETETFRGHFGLPRPKNRFTAAREAGEILPAHDRVAAGAH
ncbi:MAG: NtaA/DmoA family FMN-dependent monooxygenase [Alphaproteobacteria bacterium]|nr:NtaA/DmoA family FMN-dependent monooxygenase [Alphaproteobacteria bacterium]